MSPRICPELSILGNDIYNNHLETLTTPMSNKSAAIAAKTKPKKRPKISQKDVVAAEQFLKSSQLGEQLQAAEHALVLLLKNKLPRLRDYIFGASYDFRADEASEITAQIKLGIDKHRLIATMYYPKELSRNEARLFAGSLGEILKVTYHALGLLGPRQDSGQAES